MHPINHTTTTTAKKNKSYDLILCNDYQITNVYMYIYHLIGSFFSVVITSLLYSLFLFFSFFSQSCQSFKSLKVLITFFAFKDIDLEFGMKIVLFPLASISVNNFRIIN